MTNCRRQSIVSLCGHMYKKSSSSQNNMKSDHVLRLRQSMPLNISPISQLLFSPSHANDDNAPLYLFDLIYLFVFCFCSILSVDCLGLRKGECRPFIVDGLQVGVIRPDILKELTKFPEVFLIKNKDADKIVELNPAFRDYDERSEHVDRVLRQFRKDNVFITLKGWRDEVRPQHVLDENPIKY